MRIPHCQPPGLDETRQEYALRLLHHVLDHGTATLTDQQLDAADTAAQWYATHATGQDGQASTLESHQAAILESFSHARHAIAQTIKVRRQLDQEQAHAAPGRAIYPTPGSQGGRLAPLNPPSPIRPSQPDARPVPRTPPPSQRRPADAIRF